MAGRRAGIKRNSFRSYLNELTLRTYVRDYFISEGYRAGVGVLIGLLFLGYGLVRTVTHPSLQSLGVVLFGFGIALLCLVAPLLGGLLYSLIGRGEVWVRRRRR